MTAGEGGKKLAAAKKSVWRTPTTVFDTPAVPAELKKAGVKSLAKAVANSENAELMKKYSASANTLVICAPNGDRVMSFGGEQCTRSIICSALKNFPTIYAAYVQSRKKG